MAEPIVDSIEGCDFAAPTIQAVYASDHCYASIRLYLSSILPLAIATERLMSYYVFVLYEK